MAFNPDLVFKRQVMDVHMVDEIKNCYQCSRCADVCPVADVDDRYNPRINIMAALLGLKDFLYKREDLANIWLCQVCDTCDEVCPQKIELTEIFSLLKNISVQEGTAPDYYVAQAKAIFQNGKAIPKQPAIMRRRQKMGLAETPDPMIDEIQTILKATGLDKKVKIE